MESGGDATGGQVGEGLGEPAEGAARLPAKLLSRVTRVDDGCAVLAPGVALRWHPHAAMVCGCARGRYTSAGDLRASAWDGPLPAGWQPTRERPCGAALGLPQADVVAVHRSRHPPVAPQPSLSRERLGRAHSLEDLRLLFCAGQTQQRLWHARRSAERYPSCAACGGTRRPPSGATHAGKPPAGDPRRGRSTAAERLSRAAAGSTVDRGAAPARYGRARCPAPPGSASPLQAARSANVGRSPWVRWLLFPHHVNLHIEHHPYPAVPRYHLPVLRRKLLAREALWWSKSVLLCRDLALRLRPSRCH